MHLLFSIVLLFSINLFQTSFDEEALKEMNNRLETYENFFQGNFHSSAISTKILFFKNEYDRFQNETNDHIKESIYQNLIKVFDQIKFTYEVLNDIEYQKTLLEQQYYSLWNKSFILKDKVDKLYIVRRKVSGNIYVEANPEQRKTIRKKNIYLAGDMVYNSLLIELKNTNQCDFVGRIAVLERVNKLLEKMETLATTEDTRDIEKELKREYEVKIIEDIFNKLD